MNEGESTPKPGKLWDFAAYVVMAAFLSSTLLIGLHHLKIHYKVKHRQKKLNRLTKIYRNNKKQIKEYYYKLHKAKIEERMLRLKLEDLENRSFLVESMQECGANLGAGMETLALVLDRSQEVWPEHLEWTGFDFHFQLSAPSADPILNVVRLAREQESAFAGAFVEHLSQITRHDGESKIQLSSRLLPARQKCSLLEGGQK